MKLKISPFKIICYMVLATSILAIVCLTLLNVILECFVYSVALLNVILECFVYNVALLNVILECFVYSVTLLHYLI